MKETGDESAPISCRFPQFSRVIVILEPSISYFRTLLSNKHSNLQLFSLFFSKGR